MERKASDLSLKKINNLLVLYPDGHNKTGHIMWRCYCFCGKEKRIPTGHLTRKTNPVKSCGCLQIASGKNHKQWNGVGEISGNWWISHVVRSASTRKKKKLTITKKYAWSLFKKQKGLCKLTDLPISFKNKTASLDRINSNKGYIRNNVQWVHKHVNIMKNNFDETYLLKLCELILAKKIGGVCGI